MKNIHFCLQGEGGEKIAVLQLADAIIPLTTTAVFIHSYSFNHYKYPFSFSWALLKSFFSWYKKFRQIKADIIIVTHYSQALALIFTNQSTPYIYYFHGYKGFRHDELRKQHANNYLKLLYSELLNLILFFLQKITLKHAKSVITPSVASSYFIRNKYQFSTSDIRLKTIPHGVNSKMFYPVTLKNKDLLKKRLKISKPLVLSYIGRIDNYKGILELLQATSMIDQKIAAQLCLNIVNPSPLLEHQPFIAEYTKKINTLMTNIEIHSVRGEFKSINMWYHVSDCLILPSKEEQFPLVLLESAACGIPILASKTGGITPFLLQIDNRLLISKITPAVIAQKINWFFSLSSVERNQITRKLHHLSKRFTWDLAAKKFLNELK